MKVDVKDCTYIVAVTPPKPNKLFDEWSHNTTRFLTFSKAVPCAECGKRSKHHWTSLASFSVMLERLFTLVPSEKVHLPFTPVCSRHPIGPAIVPERKPKPAAKKEAAQKPHRQTSSPRP